MFVDTKELQIRAGKGGDGVILFHREKYVPRGGPDGGDGGRGGDVLLLAARNLHALTHLARTNEFTAENGADGGHKRCTGKSGSDMTIQVPLGTLVSSKQEDGSWLQLAELLEEGQQCRIAKGGNGGWGNWHFRSSVQQVPDHANPGQQGEEIRLKLELKIIADVGLIGLPNAGKSTLLSVVSAAKPKIAEYAFTTLEPQLGVAQIGDQQLVFADLPGLIEGASHGKGLGSTFLRHIERTHLLLHCLDCQPESEEILQNYQVVRQELGQWSELLKTKPERIVLTKADTVPAEDAEEKRALLERTLNVPVSLISAAAQRGTKELLTSLL